MTMMSFLLPASRLGAWALDIGHGESTTAMTLMIGLRGLYIAIYIYIYIYKKGWAITGAFGRCRVRSRLVLLSNASFFNSMEPILWLFLPATESG